VGQPQWQCDLQALAAQLIRSQPDPPQGFEQLRASVLRFAPGAASRRSRFLVSQQPDRVFPVVTTDGAELVQDVGFAGTIRLAVTSTDCFQVGLFRLLAHDR